MATLKEIAEAREAAEKHKRSIVERDPVVVAAAAKRREEQQYRDAQWRVNADAKTIPETVEDVVRQGATGIGRGVVSAPGAPFDIMRFGQMAKARVQAYREGRDYAAVLDEHDAKREKGEMGGPFSRYMPSPETMRKWGGEAWIKSAAKTMPELEREATTRSGYGAGVVGEIAGGTIAGDIPGMATSAINAGARYGVRAGANELAREAARSAQTAGRVGVGAAAAGEVAKQVSDDPFVQAAASTAGGGVAGLYGSRTAREALQNATGGEVRPTPAQLQASEALFQEANARGLRLSRTNALDYVTRGAAQGGSELQRVIESSGNPVLRAFYADNPQPGPTRVAAAGRAELDRIAPASAQPETIGARVAEPAQRSIDLAEQQANQAYRNELGTGGQNQAGPQVFQALMGDEAFAAAYRRVLQNPDYASLRQGVRPDSVEMIDLVRREMTSRQTGYQTPGASPAGNMDATAAQGLQGPIDAAQAAAAGASGAPDPATGRRPLEAAQDARLAGQQQNVRPLDTGATGELARAKSTEAAQAALTNPVEGSHHSIGRAIRDLSAAEPDGATAREFVRNWLGTEFSEATGRNVGGDPYKAGTKFWKSVTGTDQQALNTRAALENLPNGQDLWRGLNDLGTVFDAMGKRQDPGSKTAFNTEDIARLKGEGFDDAAIKLMGTGFTALPGMVKEGIERFRMGQNMDEVARIISDPNTGAEFARIIQETRPGSAERLIRYGRLLGTQLAAVQQTTDPVTGDPINVMRVTPGLPPGGQ